MRVRPDNISEYTITSSFAVEQVLEKLLPHLKLKRKLAILILKIIKDKKNISSKEDFIKICELVDATALLTYSKNRSITTEIVKKAIAHLE